MSSNTSQAKALSILHRAKVADYAAWSLVVTCRPYDAPRTVPLAGLPPDLTIIQALMRMRCRTCRGRVEAAILDNNLSGWRGRAVRVWGRGATVEAGRTPIRLRRDCGAALRRLDCTPGRTIAEPARQ